MQDWFANVISNLLSVQIKLLEEQLEEEKREVRKLNQSCDIKDKKIQELELELLKVTNKMAAMATDHAQQKQALNDEIIELKVSLLNCRPL